MGAEVKRKEDPRLITGTSTYVGDLALPGMHYVAFVRSPHAHARVKKIDAAAALKRPGVFKVVTGQDIRKLCAPLPIAGAGEGGSSDASANIGRKHYPLSIDRVRHVGRDRGGRGGRRGRRLGAAAGRQRHVRGDGQGRAAAPR